jgi:hypothetical protein
MKMKLSTIAVHISSLAFPQSFQGSLRGRVVDPKEAATPQVKVAITDEATSLIRATITNDEGEYVFAALNPATYTIVVEATGFNRLERRSPGSRASARRSQSSRPVRSQPGTFISTRSRCSGRLRPDSSSPWAPWAPILCICSRAARTSTN